MPLPTAFSTNFTTSPLTTFRENDPVLQAEPGPAPRVAMVSTFPPTPCGLATFAQALVAGLAQHEVPVDVVRVVDELQRGRPDGVVRNWLAEQSPDGRTSSGAHQSVTAAAALNTYDVVLLQHEYGIFGASDGEAVLGLMRHVDIPVVTVLHTVLARPTPRQHRILREVVARSAAVVTMTRTARQRAVEVYGAAPQRVRVIPHGADEALINHREPAHGKRPVVLTWGLLGRGKGIEWALHAMAALHDLDPRPVYVVAGRTHPRLPERNGEAYRRELVALAAQLGLADSVVFDDRYLDASALHHLVHDAAVVLLPYDSVEQVTSGVLSEAVAAGRPVVSTRFPHAVELLGDGTGLLVDRGDAPALAAAVRRVLTEPALAQSMTQHAEQIAPSLSWRSVAGEYLDVCRQVQPPPARVVRIAADSTANLNRVVVA